MSTNSNTSDPRVFWEFRKYKEHEWFLFLNWLLFCIVLSYLISHATADEKACYEYERLDKGQLQHINGIYFNAFNRNAKDLTVANSAFDEASASDTTAADGEATVAAAFDTVTGVAADTSMRVKSARVLDYIQHQFSYKVDSQQIEDIRPHLYSALPLEAMEFLRTLRLRVMSYFWLVGPEVYFEIVFWSLFGVIASLLFNLGQISRNRTTDPNNPNSVFDSSDIPFQFAKLLYAPLCTLAIILGYNYFSDQNIVDIGSSKGVIVFAFIGGFYSSRLIAFLDRLKEVVLPNSGTADLPVQKPAAAILLENVTIGLELDNATIPAELLNDIAEIGLRDASVTLINDESGEIVEAKRTGEDQSAIFKVDRLKPGKYSIKAIWSKEVNTSPVNLAGEQKEEIRNSDSTITVLLRKDESEG